MDITEIESCCKTLGVPVGIIDTLKPLQPKLSFHNENHTVFQTTVTAIKTIQTIRDYDIDPNCRTIIPATIGHDLAFDQDLLPDDEYINKEDRSASLTVASLTNGFGFMKNELRQIHNNIMATESGTEPKFLEDWITRMSDVHNLADPYQEFMKFGARIAIESVLLNPRSTIDDAITFWYYLGREILPKYIETRTPLPIRDITNIPGSHHWKERARVNQERLVAENSTFLKSMLLSAHDDFTLDVS